MYICSNPLVLRLVQDLLHSQLRTKDTITSTCKHKDCPLLPTAKLWGTLRLGLQTGDSHRTLGESRNYNLTLRE